MIAVDLMIDNADVKATGNATFERLNPMTGEVAARAAASSADDAGRAADAAAAAFPAWSEMAPAARRALLNKAADLIEGAGGKFAPVMGAETGSTAMWAGFNCMLAAGMVREAAAMTTQISGEIIPSNVPGSLAMGYRQPVGVVAGIAPWNAPVILGVRAIAMPLACGNTVVLKASEMCPGTHRLIGTLFREAGFPPGVVNVVTNAPKDAGAVVEALIAHPAVRRVNFTGSSRVGKIIARKCAEHLKPVLLELGGKSPLVVLDDAELDEAVNAAAFGAFANQGQICMSTERIVVDDKVADEFVARFAAKAKSLSVGDPREGKAVLGSVVDHAAAERAFGAAVERRIPLVTTNLIVAEVFRLTLFRAGREPALRGLDRIDASPSVTVHFATGDDHRAARGWLERLAPRPITYTDAVSFAAIDATKCTHVLGFDADFEAAGFELWTPRA